MGDSVLQAQNKPIKTKKIARAKAKVPKNYYSDYYPTVSPFPSSSPYPSCTGPDCGNAKSQKGDKNMKARAKAKSPKNYYSDYYPTVDRKSVV